jgi:hypothetical protein
MSLGRFLSALRFSALRQALENALRRFPLPFASSCLLTGVSLIGIYTGGGDGFLFTVGLFCTLFMLFATVSGLFAEGHSLPRAKRIAADGVAGLLALVLTFTIGKDVGFSHGLVIAAAIVSLTFAAYVRRASSEDSVWFFNYLNIVTVSTAGLSVLVIGLGASAILGTIQYLFNIPVAGELYGTIWIVASCFFFPVFILAHIPRQFDWPSDACATPFGIGFIANYLLVPLMLLYTVVLYAYFARIVVLMELPRGNLGLMVAGFGIVGVITHLACHAMQRDGGITLRFFHAHFYKLMIIPVLLMAAGLWTRIADYGVTPDRYLATACLAWLAVLSGWHVWRPRTMHIKYVPMLAAFLVLAASTGPWGAKAVSIRSQLNGVEDLLTKTGVLKNGQIQKVSAPVDFKTRQNISSKIDFLHDQDALGRLRDIGAMTDETLKNAVQDDCDDRGFMSDCDYHATAPVNIMAGWGMGHVNKWEQDDPADPGFEKFSLESEDFYNTNNALLRVAPYDYLANISLYHNQVKNGAVLKSDDGPEIKINFLSDGTISIKLADAEALTLAVSQEILALAKLQKRRLPKEDMSRLIFRGENKSLKAELAIESVSGTHDAQGKIVFQTLRGRLLFSRK